MHCIYTSSWDNFVKIIPYYLSMIATDKKSEFSTSCLSWIEVWAFPTAYDGLYSILYCLGICHTPMCLEQTNLLQFIGRYHLSSPDCSLLTIRRLDGHNCQLSWLAISHAGQKVTVSGKCAVLSFLMMDYSSILKTILYNLSSFSQPSLFPVSTVMQWWILSLLMMVHKMHGCWEVWNH